MKTRLIFIAAVAGVIGVGFLYQYRFQSEPNEKVYVAVEGESKIVSFDPATGKILSTIDLSVEHEGGKLPYAPHNVQVSPDMKTVWVTANSGAHQTHTSFFAKDASAHGGESGEDDEVVVIDPSTERIIQRIPLGMGLHLAHVVLTPNSATALVTAQNEGAIYMIDARTFAVKKRILVTAPAIHPVPQEPHGIRVSPDGLVAYIAVLKGKSLGILDLLSNEFSLVPLGGSAVQAGITPNGTFAFVSLYDTKELAVYRTDTKEMTKVALPKNAKGPVQMFATPDSRFVYLADQGYYFDQPSGELVYKIDLETLEVVKEIKAGQGPHGVAISEDGARVYVTNLLSGDVSIIDTSTDKETSTIKVGKEPNGVSVWVKR